MAQPMVHPPGSRSLAQKALSAPLIASHLHCSFKHNVRNHNSRRRRIWHNLWCIHLCYSDLWHYDLGGSHDLRSSGHHCGGSSSDLCSSGRHCCGSSSDLCSSGHHCCGSSSDLCSSGRHCCGSSFFLFFIHGSSSDLCSSGHHCCGSSCDLCSS